MPTFEISCGFALAERIYTRFGNVGKGDIVLIRSPEDSIKFRHVPYGLIEAIFQYSIWDDWSQNLLESECPYIHYNALLWISKSLTQNFRLFKIEHEECTRYFEWLLMLYLKALFLVRSGHLLIQLKIFLGSLRKKARIWFLWRSFNEALWLAWSSVCDMC